MLSSPIFILSSPCSFTPLVAGMLGQHPEAYGFPELNLFTCNTIRELLNRYRGKAQPQMHGILRTIAQLYSGEQTCLSISMAYRWLMARYAYSTAEAYLEICQKICPLRGVDHSHAYSLDFMYLDRIFQTFPDAYFVHLVKHPLTQGTEITQGENTWLAKTLKYYDYESDPPVIDPQFAWLSAQKRIIEFLKGVSEKQQLLLRGEDLLSEPKLYCEKICSWLGLSWNDSVFDAMIHPEDSYYACLGPFGATLGNDAGFLQSPLYEHQPNFSISLADPLPWRSDNKGFIPEVIQLAHQLGYD
jgi:hypothetical protein